MKCFRTRRHEFDCGSLVLYVEMIGPVADGNLPAAHQRWYDDDRRMAEEEFSWLIPELNDILTRFPDDKVRILSLNLGELHLYDNTVRIWTEIAHTKDVPDELVAVIISLHLREVIGAIYHTATQQVLKLTEQRTGVKISKGEGDQIIGTHGGLRPSLVRF